MVRKINSIEDIKWRRLNPPLKDEDLALLEKFSFKIPSIFIALMKISDGGYVDYDFDYYDLHFNKIMCGGIGQIYGINTESTITLNRNYDPFGSKYNQQEYFVSYNDILNQYNNMPEFFPENIVAFGRNGGGNMVCFDYRDNVMTNNPPIVYWIIGHDIGEDVSFVANNFEEFIKMLREPEDDY
jgi:hypothetical protein